MAIDPLTGAGATQPGKSGKLQSDVETIKEKGFTAFVEELRARKIEEIRAKILEAMGLTEDSLAKLPAEQQSVINKLINEEITRRMTAGSAAEDDPLSPELAGLANLTALRGQGPGGGPTASLANGQAILQALSDADWAAAPDSQGPTDDGRPAWKQA
ncbi:hypothetical protein [Roseospirillum parvum]|uniref:Uncharacterized protein n=1 Tax=Roseospirillum parvum TaxID=83401 RepID=A0A1G7V3Y6_9PROT|nr:hypothetical protein [Roseospirillum parvum]SDG53670.1 hypothetical protein SAMN05421742_101508 [Roseospirillum parvum]